MLVTDNTKDMFDIEVEKVPLYNGGRTRFDMIVDKTYGHQLAAVTKQYPLVQNEDFITAAEHAMYDLGGDLGDFNFRQGEYYNGKSRFRYSLPDMNFSVYGDQSKIWPGVVFGNNYAAQGSLWVAYEAWRQVCSNGMMGWGIVRLNSIQHRGTIDYDRLYNEIYAGLQILIDKFATERIVAETMAQTTVSTKQVNEYIDMVLENTAKKYEETIINNMKSNIRELGQTAWAMSQAITETSTHDMKTWGADDWARKNVHALIESTVNAPALV